MGELVTLWCEAGEHNWKRPSQRGRRPVNCPEHSASDTPALTDEEKAARARERIEKARKTRSTTQKQLDNNAVNRVVQYRKWSADHNRLWKTREQYGMASEEAQLAAATYYERWPIELSLPPIPSDADYSMFRLHGG